MESFATVKIKLTDGTGNQGEATGFFVRFGRSFYLVTAKHAVLGLKGFGVEHYQSRRWIPRFLDTNCFRTKGDILENISIGITLFDESKMPSWNEMYEWDIVSFDVTNRLTSDEFEPIAIDISEISYSLDETEQPIAVSANLDLPAVAQEVFVVGYPKGISLVTPDSLPIWKRASVATEPHVNLNGEPIFLIDTFGREGLSGGPVLYRGAELISPSGIRRKRDAHPEVFHLVGVYVGREGFSEDQQMTLGRVFKRSTVQDTIMNVRTGE